MTDQAAAFLFVVLFAWLVLRALAELLTRFRGILDDHRNDILADLHQVRDQLARDLKPPGLDELLGAQRRYEELRAQLETYHDRDDDASYAETLEKVLEEYDRLCLAEADFPPPITGFHPREAST